MVLSSNPSKVLADGNNLEFFGFHPGCCYVQKRRENSEKKFGISYTYKVLSSDCPFYV